MMALSQEITFVLIDESRGCEAHPPVAFPLSPQAQRSPHGIEHHGNALRGSFGLAVRRGHLACGPLTVA